MGYMFRRISMVKIVAATESNWNGTKIERTSEEFKSRFVREIRQYYLCKNSPETFSNSLCLYEKCSWDPWTTQPRPTVPYRRSIDLLIENFIPGSTVSRDEGQPFWTRTCSTVNVVFHIMIRHYLLPQICYHNSLVRTPYLLIFSL